MNKGDIEAFNDLYHQIILGIMKSEQNIELLGLKNISMLELQIIKFVYENKNKLLKEIRESLDIPNSTLTSAIDRLEKRGILRRAISQKDRRSFTLKLTEFGKKVQEEHDKMDIQVAKDILGLLDSDEERKILINLLTKIVEKAY